MTYDYSYCEAWPQELKDAKMAAYRAALRVENSENAVKTAPPQEFDALMDKLEAATEECRKAGLLAFNLHWSYEQSELRKRMQTPTADKC